MSRNNYYYNDEYMYFTFKEMHSSEYNVFIQNDLEDLKMYINSGISIDYASPKYKNDTYLLGVTRSQREIPLKIAAQGLTRQEIVQVLYWLRPGTVGVLNFDFAPDWVYDVIVDSLADPNIYSNGDDKFAFSTEVKFKTVGKYLARNKIDAYVECNKESDYEFDLNSACNNNFIIPIITTNTSNIDDNSWPIVEYVKNEKEEIIGTQFLATPKQENGYASFYILNLGNGPSIINVDMNIEENSKEIFFNLNIKFADQFAKVSGKAKEKNHILSYSGKNHLFFLDNYLPELAKKMGSVSDLVSEYSNKDLTLNSSVVPFEINTVVQDKSIVKEYLLGLPYDWFIAIPIEPDDQTEYLVENEDVQGNKISPYPLSFKETITTCKILFRDQLTTDENENEDPSKIESFLNLGDSFIVGSYNKIEINASHDFVLSVTQHTEVI